MCPPSIDWSPARILPGSADAICVVPFVLWVISELAAMATDLAEFLAGAIGFSVLLQIPKLVGMAITAILSYGLLLMQARGFRPLKRSKLLLALLGLSYIAQLVVPPADRAAVLMHSVTQRLQIRARSRLPSGLRVRR
jgi:manganese transport protein